MKHCRVCTEIKNLEEYHKEARNKDGHRSECKQCRNAYRKENYLKNLPREKAKRKRWYKNNKKKAAELNRLWRENNRERHRELMRYHSMKRHVNRIQATVSGFEDELKEIYFKCPKNMQVDHIIPLQGKTVCGLHVPWNLQYLTPEENRKKGNKLL